MGVAVAEKAEPSSVAVLLHHGGEPDLAHAALHLVGGTSVLRREGLERAAKLDDVAIAVFPILE